MPNRGCFTGLASSSRPYSENWWITSSFSSFFSNGSLLIFTEVVIGAINNRFAFILWSPFRFFVKEEAFWRTWICLLNVKEVWKAMVKRDFQTPVHDVHNDMSPTTILIYNISIKYLGKSHLAALFGRKRRRWLNQEW